MKKPASITNDKATLILNAIRHAQTRLNEIPHRYADTDFKLIRDGIAAAESLSDLTQPRNKLDCYYDLKGTCKGCRRVTWLCRRDRRCRRYNKKPKPGCVAKPTGFYPPNDQAQF